MVNIWVHMWYYEYAWKVENELQYLDGMLSKYLKFFAYLVLLGIVRLTSLTFFLVTSYLSLWRRKTNNTDTHMRTHKCSERQPLHASVACTDRTLTAYIFSHVTWGWGCEEVGNMGSHKGIFIPVPPYFAYLSLFDSFNSKGVPHSPLELHPLHSLPMLPLDPLRGSLVLSGKAVSWMMALGVSMSCYRQELASQDTGHLSCPDTTPSKSPINSLFLAWGGWASLCEVGAQTQLVFRFGHNFVPLFGSR